MSEPLHKQMFDIALQLATTCKNAAPNYHYDDVSIILPKEVYDALMADIALTGTCAYVVFPVDPIAPPSNETTLAGIRIERVEPQTSPSGLRTKVGHPTHPTRRTDRTFSKRSGS